MSTVSREEVEGVGLVVEVPSFYDLLAYRPKGDEVKTIVFPSPVCSLVDLPAIICLCEKRGYTYGPHAGLKSSAAAAAAGASKQQDDSKDPQSGKEEAGQSTGTEKQKVA